MTSHDSFSGFRKMIWPIYMKELPKFLPMAFMMFGILFNYTCLRNIKDSLIVTAPNSGAEALQFIKFFCVTPSAVLFMLLYVKMSNVLSKENLFYATLAPFILFFGAFGFIIYPNKDMFHPDWASIAHLQQSFPAFHWFFSIYGNWVYALFYVLSELWGTAVLTLSFWQFANQITPVPEAKRFYALFGMIGNLGTAAAGWVTWYFSDIREHLPADVDAWGVSLNWLMGCVVVCGLASMGLYRWMHTAVLTQKRFYDPEQITAKKKKSKPSLKESFGLIFQSKYLGFIAILVISYGISINLVEGVWKSQIKIQFPNPNDYGAFMGQYSMYTGILTILFMLVGANILRLFSWFTGAVITPGIIVVTGFLFFVFVLFRDGLAHMIEAVGTTPVYLAVIIGAVQGLLSKSIKYSLFDPTKEMAYIPLDDDLKVKGKAVVDVVGGRLGKSGGAAVQAALLGIIPAATYATITPFLFGVFLVICLFWFVAVKGLSKEFNILMAKKNKKS